MSFPRHHQLVFFWMFVACLGFGTGCSGVRVPAIDPSGERFFLPAGNSTTIMLPENCSEHPFLPDPVFTRPPVPPRCEDFAASLAPPRKQPGLGDCLHPARAGELQVVPTTVVAPVSSEVIMVGGICGSNGRYVINKELEWLLSQESVGNFVDAGHGPHEHVSFFANRGEKESANYARSKTLRHPMRIDRGTESPLDDVSVSRGQAWVTLTSPSEGTSYVTCWSPDTEGWDRRRKTVKVHWLDASWILPTSQVVRSGTEHELTVAVRKTTSGEPVSGWQVEYEILPNSVPAGFQPTLSTKARVPTNESGNATLRIRQPVDQTGPGVTNVKVTVVRPENALGTKEKLVVAESVVSITWSAPALTLRATGPTTSPKNGQFVYALELSNPGDLPAENVQIAVGRPNGLEWLSANPSPAEFGDQWVWNLGTLPARSAPVRVEIAARAIGAGTVKTCFAARADNVGRQVETCIETRIETPCLGFRFLQEPKQARVGEEVRYKILVSNECEQRLENIEVEVAFDEGLRIEGLVSPIGREPFSLGFGETREMDLDFQVVAPGNQCLRIAITADGGHTLRASSCLLAEETPQASIDVQVIGPRTMKLGQPQVYEIRVENTGNLILPSPSVYLRLSPELLGESATTEFTPDADGLLKAVLGELEPQTSSVIKLLVRGAQPSDTAGLEVYAVSADLMSETRQLPITVFPAVIPVEPPGGAVGGQEEGPAITGPAVQVPGEARTNSLVVSATELNDPLGLNQRGGVLLSLKNDRNEVDRDVRIEVALPDGLTYVGGSEDDTLVLVPDRDRPSILIGSRREMRAGDEVKATLILSATTVGEKEIQVRAVSERTPSPVAESATLEVIP